MPYNRRYPITPTPAKMLEKSPGLYEAHYYTDRTVRVTFDTPKYGAKARQAALDFLNRVLPAVDTPGHVAVRFGPKLRMFRGPLELRPADREWILAQGPYRYGYRSREAILDESMPGPIRITHYGFNLPEARAFAATYLPSDPPAVKFSKP